MKKLFLIIATTILATTAWAQSQLLSVKGKTEDGKSINVQYYKGTAQDYIKSVKYQLVDELKADNKAKQNTITDLQHQLNKANKTIENLNSQLKSTNSGNADCSGQLAEKQSEIDQLTEQIERLTKQVNDLQKENDKLWRQNDSIRAINYQMSLKKTRLAKSHVVGVEAGMGAVTLLGNQINDPWKKALSWNKQVTVYYGTPNLVEGLPISVEAGLGFRSLPMSAKVNYFEVMTDPQQDCDNYSFQPVYVFDNSNEKLVMNSVEVPIRVCWGEPSTDKVSLYTKLGVTPAFILSASMANGPFSRKGYYDAWHVCLEDIEELDFFNNDGADKTSVSPSKRFSLSGNLAFGAYLPLNKSMLFNVGAKFDYPLTKTGSFTSNAGSGKSNYYQLIPEKYRSGLSQYNGRMLTSSLQLGLVYKLK